MRIKTFAAATIALIALTGVAAAQGVGGGAPKESMTTIAPLALLALLSAEWLARSAAASLGSSASIGARASTNRPSSPGRRC